MAKLLLSAFEYLLGETALEKQAAEKIKRESTGDTSPSNDRLILRDFIIRPARPSANDDVAKDAMAQYDIDDNLPPLIDHEEHAPDGIHTAVSILDSLAESLNTDEAQGKAPLFLAAFKNKFMS
jgi:hypothetical protein